MLVDMLHRTGVYIKDEDATIYDIETYYLLDKGIVFFCAIGYPDGVITNVFHSFEEFENYLAQDFTALEPLS